MKAPLGLPIEKLKITPPGSRLERRIGITIGLLVATMLAVVVEVRHRSHAPAAVQVTRGR